MDMFYQTPYRITLKDGTECDAMLIHLNPRFYTHTKNHKVWKRLDGVPRKMRYVQEEDVVRVAR